VISEVTKLRQHFNLQLVVASENSTTYNSCSTNWSWARETQPQL